MNLAVSTMARTGRHRKNGPRKPSGRLRHKSQQDLGTPEVVAHRLALAGAADATLAHYPLGIALARQIITLEQHDAGLDYARVYTLAMDGLPERLQPSLARFLPAGGGEIPETVQIKATRRFVACQLALLGMSRKHKDLIDNLCVFNRWPGWLGQGVPSPAELRDREKVRVALERLCRV